MGLYNRKQIFKVLLTYPSCHPSLRNSVVLLVSDVTWHWVLTSLSTFCWYSLPWEQKVTWLLHMPDFWLLSYWDSWLLILFEGIPHYPLSLLNTGLSPSSWSWPFASMAKAIQSTPPFHLLFPLPSWQQEMLILGLTKRRALILGWQHWSWFLSSGNGSW